MPGSIVDYTNKIAGELATRCKDAPAEELATWIRMAEQREAMVVELYDGVAIRRRLKTAPSDEMGEVVVKTIGSIWAQETSHTRLLGSLRTVADERAPHVERLMGAVEGAVTDRATAGGLTGAMARWLVGLGRALGKAPDFTSELAPLAFAGFCRFSNELEQTAAHGYARMAALIDRIEKDEPDLRFGLWTRYEVSKTLAEERLHAAVFERIVGWLAADGDRLMARNARRCVGELRELAAAYLAIPAVRELPEELRPEHTGRGAELNTNWVSDGGLADLFRAYDYDVPVVRDDVLKSLGDHS